MEVGMLVADGGRIFATESQVKKIIQKGGAEWDLALDDGCPDPLYCKGMVRISKFDKAEPTKEQPGRKFVIEGTIDYNMKPRAFRGWSKKVTLGGKKTLVHHFNFTEPATPMGLKK